MDHRLHTPQPADPPARVPPMVWIAGLGLLAAVVAVAVFNVPLGAVASYGLFALFLGGHFFMHGSHGGHGGPVPRNAPPGGVGGTASTAQSDKDGNAGHSSGCH